MAFVAYLRRLYGPVSELANVHVDVMTSLALFERLFHYLDLKPEIAEPPNALVPPPARGEIQFDQVSFGYVEGRLALDDVSFVAKPGQLVALVGPSGAGKTTVTYLVPRFYDPLSGAVRVDGHDVRELSLNWLRSQIGIVTQETYLFHATVNENLRYGRPGRHGRRDRGRLPGREHPRVHRGAAGRVRDAGRRARLPALGRREAAAGDRARPAEGPAHPAAGRGDLVAGLALGGADPGGADAAADGPDEPGDRPPPEHDPGGGRDPGAGSGPAGGAGHARRAAGARRPLRPPLRGAVQARAATAPPPTLPSPPIRAPTSKGWLPPPMEEALDPDPCPVLVRYRRRDRRPGAATVPTQG